MAFDATNFASVLGAMRANLNDADVQGRACDALRALAGDYVADKQRADMPACAKNREDIAMAGGVNDIVVAMRAHASNAGIQLKGCWAIWCLYYRSGMADTPRAKPGEIECVVAAMGGHPRSADIQAHGCGALRRIACNADNKVLVSKAGGIECIVAAMRAHPGNAAVQEWACAALINIGWSSTSIRAKIAAAGGPELARIAMRAFPTLAGVQTEAKDLLEKLAS